MAVNPLLSCEALTELAVVSGYLISLGAQVSMLKSLPCPEDDTHICSFLYIFFVQKKADVVTWLTFPSWVLCMANSTCGSQDPGGWGALLGWTTEPPRGELVLREGRVGGRPWGGCLKERSGFKYLWGALAGRSIDIRGGGIPLSAVRGPHDEVACRGAQRRIQGPRGPSWALGSTGQWKPFQGLGGRHGRVGRALQGCLARTETPPGASQNYGPLKQGSHDGRWR